jgi:hypothetical protein
MASMSCRGGVIGSTDQFLCRDERKSLFAFCGMAGMMKTTKQLRVRQRTLALVIPFSGIIVAKVVTAYAASGTSGDEALSVVLIVLACGLVLVAAFALPVFVTAYRRLGVLRRRFPAATVVTALNVSGMLAKIRKLDAASVIGTRGYYGVVLDSTGLSLWQGGSHPVAVACVPNSELRGARAIHSGEGRSSDIRIAIDAMAGDQRVEVPMKLLHATLLGPVSFDDAESADFVTQIRSLVERREE